MTSVVITGMVSLIVTFGLSILFPFKLIEKFE